MGVGKKLVGFGLGAAVLLLAVVSPVGAADAPSPSLLVKSDVQIARDLGVVRGDGQGLTDDYLAKSTTRMQAATMLVRFTGVEANAVTYRGADNFTDAAPLSKEERSVLAFLKAHPELGWEGVGDNRFDPLSLVTAQQFYKVMLVTLGYKEDRDFAYEDTLSFAKAKGLYRAASAASFHNRDIATAAVEALKVKINGSDDTLAQRLNKAGIITAEMSAELTYDRLDLVESSSLGNYLVDGEGRTLYYFAKNAPNPNACQAKCLQAWPIYDSGKLQIPAGLNAADFGRFLRSDGSTQLTYKGWPVYYFADDDEPGDTYGEDVGHVWYVFHAADAFVAVGTKADLGNYLTDDRGMTLYYFKNDTTNVSNCSGACAQNWPPYHVENPAVPTGVDAKDFGTITRADGTKQTAYKGMPLYYFANDNGRGDTTGQGVKDVWFVIDPASFTGAGAPAAAASK